VHCFFYHEFINKMKTNQMQTKNKHTRRKNNLLVPKNKQTYTVRITHIHTP